MPVSLCFNVIAPPKAQLAREMEGAKANAYLISVVGQVEPGMRSFRNETVMSDSVAEAIVDYAKENKSDLIVVFTYNQRGLAGLFKGSVSAEVQKRAGRGEDI